MFGVKLRPFSILVTDFFGEKKAAFCFINAETGSERLCELPKTTQHVHGRPARKLSAEVG